MTQRLRVVVAMNAFKGSLSAKDATQCVASGFLRGFPEAEVLSYPMADGGDGTVDVLLEALGGRKVTVTVTGPNGDPVDAAVGVLEDGAGKTVVIESASASGLALVPPEERDVFRAQCRGVGELMVWAAEHGASRIIVGIGGTAMNDGGIGAIQAAGGEVLDEQGSPVPPGIDGLLQVRRVSPGQIRKRFGHIKVVGVTDVKNPLVGPDGATHVYGPQKGLSTSQVQMVDEAMGRYASLISEALGRDPSAVPMCGSGGGLGAALWAFFDAEMVQGARFIMEETGLQDAIPGCSLVITGEGRVDSQTREGKVPYTVAQRCQALGVPCLVFAGALADDVVAKRPIEYTTVLSAQVGPSTLSDSMKNVLRNLSIVAEGAGTLYRSAILCTAKEKVSVAGGVVLRTSPAGDVEVLLIKDKMGVYALPKGHMEPGEDPLRAAVREVLEETGVEAEIMAKVGEFSHRFFANDMTPVLKTVTYFAMRVVGGEPRPQAGETLEVRWVPFHQVDDLTTYGNVREIISGALAHYPWKR